MDRKERVEILKLIEETKALRQQSSKSTRITERLKAIAGMAVVITALVTLVGMFSSIWRYQSEETLKRRTQQLSELNHSIELLADQNTAKKLAGIASLESFLRSNEVSNQGQILTVMGNILAVEDNKIVRDAITDSFKALDFETMDPSVKYEFLKHLVSLSNSIVQEGNLHLKRTDRPNHFEGKEAKAHSISNAIITFLRHTDKFTELSGIYCVKCDFSNFNIENANFTNSILYLSDFSNSVLIGANFDGADIENTRFVRADLRDSKFTIYDDPRPGHNRITYVNNSFKRAEGSWDSFYGPNFNCSDLRNADFTGHPIFGFATEASDTFILHTSFVGADIQGANFSSALFYGAKEVDQEGPFPFYSGMQSSKDIQEYFQFEFSDWINEGDFEKTKKVLYENDFMWLRQGFSGSNWTEAELPKPIRKLLDDNPPVRSLDFGIRDQCLPLASRKGFNPKQSIHERNSIKIENVIDAINNKDLSQFFDFIIWSSNAKGFDSSELSDNEKVIFDCARFLVDVKDYGLNGLMLWDEDKIEYDELLTELIPIGSKNLIKYLEFVYPILKNVKLQHRIHKDIYFRIYPLASLKKLNSALKKNMDIFEENLWNYVNINQKKLLESMKYNR